MTKYVSKFDTFVVLLNVMKEYDTYFTPLVKSNDVEGVFKFIPGNDSSFKKADVTLYLRFKPWLCTV